MIEENEFDLKDAYDTIRGDMLSWATKVGAKKVVLGISGGKDSTVVAKLASIVFGGNNVYGIMMPNGRQADIEDSRRVIKHTGINPFTINIGEAHEDMLSQLEVNGIEPSDAAQINLAPRLRMSALYSVAQSIGGFVFNTDNLSERVVGWSTLWGDSVGDYAPIQNLTTCEVVALGQWLKIPTDLVDKIPSDGLCGKSDEEKMGISYSDLHDLIRCPPETFERVAGGVEGTFAEETRKIAKYYANSQYKRDAIHLPGAVFDLPFNLETNLRWMEDYKYDIEGNPTN